MQPASHGCQGLARRRVSITRLPRLGKTESQHHTVAKAWQDGESAPKDAPSGKGKRLIILHAGSANGWIPDAELVFVGKKDTSDYHGEMNQAHFEEWWEHDLLPNLPPMAVIVLDNAPYHNRRTDETIAPTSSSKKADIIAWLQANVPHNPGSLKAVLYTLLKQNKKKPEYVVDELAGAQGFAVARLPVGHCELNPVELVWAHVKIMSPKTTPRTGWQMSSVLFARVLRLPPKTCGRGVVTML